MKEIALVSANIGEFDHVRNHCRQHLKADIFYYLDSPFPMSGMNDRMKAKFIKIETHQFIDRPYYLWMDSSMVLKDEGATQKVFDKLGDKDMVIMSHPKRPNAYEELLFLLEGINQKEKYISKRYKKDNVMAEYAWLKAENFPEHFPLYACGFFLRRNNAKVNAAFDEWWRLCTQFTEFDQALFSYVAYKHKLNIVTMDYKYVTETLCEKLNHIYE